MNIRIVSIAACFFALAGQPVLAADMDHSTHVNHGAGKAAAAPLSEGVVKKTDAAKGTVTLAHGPLKNLDMGPMTMSFKAAPADLAKLKAGDKVRFLAEDNKGVLTASRFEPAK